MSLSRIVKALLGLVFVVILLIWADESLPLRPDPLASPPGGVTGWLRYPRETNAFRRAPTIRSDLHAVFALPGTDRVWVAGTNGMLLHSRDGGATWTKDTVFGLEGSRRGSYAGTTRDLAFVDSLVGWAAGEALLSTRDGGRTWRMTDLGGPAALEEVAFPTPASGYVAGSGRVLRTLNGGARWSTLERDSFHIDVAFGGPALGWMVSETALSQTLDGGEQWRPRAIPGLFAGARLGEAAVHASGAGCVLIHAGTTTSVACTRSTRDNLGWRALDFHATALHVSAAGIWVGGEAGRLVFARDIEDPWTEVPLPMERRINALSFADRDVGYIVGDGGTVLRTTDGGREWSRAAAALTVEDVEHVEGSRLVALASDSVFLASSDGGRTWTLRGIGPLRLNDMAFSSPSEGWMVGEDGAVLRSHDGGRTWRAERRRPGEPEHPDTLMRGDFVRVAFLDPEVGGIADRAGGLHLTTDGGLTWRRSSSPDSSTFLDVELLDDGAWVLTTSGLWRVLGDRWSRIPDAPSGGGVLASAGPARIWIATPRGTLYRSEDAGRRWEETPEVFDEDPAQLAMVGPEKGWAVGRRGRVWHTANGGRTWSANSLPLRPHLQALTVVGDSLVLAGGEGAALFEHRQESGWRSLPDPPSRSASPGFFLAVAIAIAGTIAFVWRDVRRPLTVLPDEIDDLAVLERPLGPSDVDRLERRRLAATLSAFLRNHRTKPPLTVAISGRWGVGKSSLMSMTMDHLRTFGYQPVSFNAWPHRKEEHLLAALLETIREEGVPGWSRPDIALAFRWRLLRRRMKHHRPLVLVLTLAITWWAGALLADPAKVARLRGGFRAVGEAMRPGPAHGGSDEAWPKRVLEALLSEEASTASPLTPILGAAVLLFLAWKASTAFGVRPLRALAQLVRPVRLQDFSALAGSRHVFAREFRDVTEALGRRKMVIFIDDLDRGAAPQVLELLAAVNFLALSGRCIIVLGLDRARVRQYVSTAFAEEAAEAARLSRSRIESERDREARRVRLALADEFLEKLIQIELHLDTPQRRQLAAVIASQREAGSPLTAAARILGAARRRARPIGSFGAAALALLVGMCSGEPKDPSALRRAPADTETAAATAVLRQPVLRAEPSAAAPGESPAPLAASPAPKGGALLAVPSQPATGHRWIPVAIGALVLVFLVWWFVRRWVARPGTETFRMALDAWAPFLARHATSLRGSKAFLHRMRLIAVHVDTHLVPDPPPSAANAPASGAPSSSTPTSPTQGVASAAAPPTSATLGAVPTAAVAAGGTPAPAGVPVPPAAGVQPIVPPLRPHSQGTSGVPRIDAATEETNAVVSLSALHLCRPDWLADEDLSSHLPALLRQDGLSQEETDAIVKVCKADHVRDLAAKMPELLAVLAPIRRAPEDAIRSPGSGF